MGEMSEGLTSITNGQFLGCELCFFSFLLVTLLVFLWQRAAQKGNKNGENTRKCLVYNTGKIRTKWGECLGEIKLKRI